MWHVAVLFFAALVAGIAMGGEPTLSVYSEADRVVYGQASNLVVEVTNDRGGVISVSDLPTLRAYSRPTPGVQMAPDAIREIAVPSKVNSITIECLLPSDAPRRMLAPRLPKDRTNQMIGVDVGQSAFVKIRLPAEAFSVGTCTFTAVLKDPSGKEISRSAPRNVACVVEDPTGQQGGPTR